MRQGCYIAGHEWNLELGLYYNLKRGLLLFLLQCEGIQITYFV